VRTAKNDSVHSLIATRVVVILAAVAKSDQVMAMGFIPSLRSLTLKQPTAFRLPFFWFLTAITTLPIESAVKRKKATVQHFRGLIFQSISRSPQFPSRNWNPQIS
jgi:hypothetical protein